jgi:hypothetical protein
LPEEDLEREPDPRLDPEPDPRLDPDPRLELELRPLELRPLDERLPDDRPRLPDPLSAFFLEALSPSSPGSEWMSSNSEYSRSLS